MGHMGKHRNWLSGVGVALATVLMLTGTASADSAEAFEKSRTELGFGMLVGGFSVGPVSGAAVGVHVDVGRQMGPLKLFGEYNFLTIGEASGAGEVDPIRGVMNRLGLNARYNFGEVSDRRDKIQGTFWAEAGVGREIIDWHKGGRLRRDDLSFGFGAQFNLRMNRDRRKPKVFGFYYALKVTVAESPDAEQMTVPTCGGPCDEATGPSTSDYGVYFNLGLQWGK